MRLIETQSKTTIVKWCNEYAREHISPIYEKDYPEDSHLKNELNVSNEWLERNTSEQVASRQCKKMEKVLHKVTIIDDHNPAKINLQGKL